MNEFYKTLTFVNEKMYEPTKLKIKCIEEEKQNYKYGAGRFELSGRTVRFRVAHTTPTKIGQFVAMWEKDKANKNQAFPEKEAPDLLVITTLKNEREWGQFVFPKEVLLKQQILKTDQIKGRMGIRVYPSWDNPTSIQAKQTQKWQLAYFIHMDNREAIPTKMIKKRYAL